MIVVENIKVRSFDLDYLEVSWEIADTNEDVLDYTFQILRSEGPAGPFHPITDAFQNLFTFRDIEANQLSKYREWYYKIRVKRRTTGTSQDYPANISGVAIEAQPDLEALEISNRMKLLLKEFTGRKVWIYPVMTFGQRCSCFDTETDRKTRSQCLTCFDVGYVNGYHTPIEIHMQIDPTRKATRLTDVAEFNDANATGRLANFPRLKPREIVIESENRRWRVHSVHATEKLRSVVHQEVTLHLIPRTDIEYRLPVNVTLSTLQPSPSRQYLNAHKV